MTLMSDKTTPDGRKMVAIPFTINLVAYTEEHHFYEQMSIVGGDIAVIQEMHDKTMKEVLAEELEAFDKKLASVQEGWQTILVERIK